MRITGMMGEVVGIAASICKKFGVNPSIVYNNHLYELKALMREGEGEKCLQNNQKYNEADSLNEKLEVQ